MADMLSMDFTKANPQNWSSGQSSSSSGNGFDKLLAGAVPGLGLASAGVNLLDSLFGFSANRQQRHQKELMDKQQSQWKAQNKILQEQALEQWNRENEYNDPTNALKRLLNGAEANGITKAGVLGGQVGGVSGQLNSSFDAQGNTAMTSTAGASLLPMGNSNSLLGLKQRTELNYIDAMAEEAESRAEVNRASVGESASRTVLNNIRSEVERETVSLVSNQALSERARFDLTKVNTALRKAELVFQEMENTAFQPRFEVELSKAWASVKNINLDSLYKSATTEKVGKETLWYDRMAQNTLDIGISTIALNYAYARTQNALQRKYGQETNTLMYKNRILQNTYKDEIDRIKTQSKLAGITGLSNAYGKSVTTALTLAGRYSGNHVERLGSASILNYYFSEMMSVVGD